MTSFQSVLFRSRFWCLIGQLALGVSITLLILLAGFLLAALADALFVLSEESRRICLAVLFVWAGIGLLASCWFAFRVARRLPAELDQLNNDRRHTISCALGLTSLHGGKGLAGWLAGQAEKQAIAAVRQARRHYPALRRWFYAGVWIVLGSAIGLYAASSHAFLVLGERLLFPERDIPPLSPYTFIISPAQPETYYGDDLVLSVQIECGEGAEAPTDIRMLLKMEGVPIQNLPAFRDSSGKWVRVLEKVTSPCSIAFATADGRARSSFVPVRVNTRPRILSGKAVITPLPYTGEALREVQLGGSEIQVPDGGSASFELVCSREIAGGYGLFTPSGSQEPLRVDARAEGKQLHLSMKVRAPGTLLMQVTDASGREADAPVQIRLSVLPDTPPEVRISQPEDGSLLVAGHPLEVKAEAEDDYGISRFSLYKALAPFRQHGVSVLEGKGRKQSYAHTYDTAALGLKPGDRLELRAEVGDENPFRFNIISSPTTTVTVISQEDYAEILRLQLSYDQFLARYEALEAAFADVSEALKTASLAETPEDRDLALQKAKGAMRQARELAASVAGDFPAFDMDGELSQLAEEMAGACDSYLSELDSITLQTPADEAREKINKINEALRAQEEALEQQSQEAEQVALMAQVMNAMRQFFDLVEKQEQMTQLFYRFKEEFGTSSTREPGQLEGLGAEQASLRDEYARWEESLSPLLSALGKYPQHQAVRRQVFAMRTACEQAGVEGLMDQASTEAMRHQPADAHAYALQALEGLRSLLQQDCSSEQMQQKLSECAAGLSAAARQTLKQMLEDCTKGNSRSQGQKGSGQGNGISMVPGRSGRAMIGPQRKEMNAMRGRGRGNPRQPESADSGRSNSVSPFAPPMEDDGKQKPHAPSFPDIPMEQVPPAYRDAVRSYFSH